MKRVRRWLRDKLYLWEYIFGCWGEKVDPDPKHYDCRVFPEVITPVLQSGDAYYVTTTWGPQTSRGGNDAELS